MFLKDARKLSIEDDLINMNENNAKKYIIGSSQVPFTFEQYKSLDKNNTKIIDLADDNIHTHPEISANSTVEQVYYLNKLLLNDTE